MNYLIYGDLINSREKTKRQIKYFWNLFSLLNKQKKIIVPFIPLLGDAFHGIVQDKKETLELIEEIKIMLDKKGLSARYVIIPVRGDFTSINTEKKFVKLFTKTHCNPLNIPELIIADKEMNKFKTRTNGDSVLILRTPSILKRQKNHKLMTKEYWDGSQ